MIAKGSGMCTFFLIKNNLHCVFLVIVIRVYYLNSCKDVYACFLIFNNSLFALNYSPILSISLFTVKKRVEILQEEKKRLVSSANIMGSKIFEALQRSFAHIKNNKAQMLILGELQR